MLISSNYYKSISASLKNNQDAHPVFPTKKKNVTAWALKLDPIHIHILSISVSVYYVKHVINYVKYVVASYFN